MPDFLENKKVLFITTKNLDYIRNSQAVSQCDQCGRLIKPEVVLYEESLDSRMLGGALQDIQQADMLIIGGTSLVVYPAAGLVNYYRGSRLLSRMAEVG